MSETEHDLNTRVQSRAYQLWQQAGEPEGRHEEFWHQAWADVSRAGAGDAVSAESAASKAGQGLSNPEDAEGAAG